MVAPSFLLKSIRFYLENEMYLFRKTFFDLSRQWRYLQLEKPSGIEIGMPIHKRLAIDFLEGMAKKTPGSDRVNVAF